MFIKFLPKVQILNFECFAFIRPVLRRVWVGRAAPNKNIEFWCCLGREGRAGTKILGGTVHPT